MNSHIIPNLTLEQKATVRKALAQKETLSVSAGRLATRPPDGLGFPISTTTLFRLKRMLEIEDQVAQIGATRADATSIAAQMDTAKYTAASLVLLKEKAFQLALLNDPWSIELSCRILRNLQWIERPIGVAPLTADLCRQIAENVLFHHEEVGNLRSDSTFDHPRKVQLVAEILFGATAIQGNS